MARRVKYFFKPGDVFGHWTVVDGVRYGKPAKIDVKCICGTIKRIDVYSLLHKRSTNCGCQKMGQVSSLWTGVQNLSGTAIHHNLQAAGSTATVNLGTREAGQVFTAQSSSCALTGTTLDSTTARLVRYDNTKPYQSGNVAWVHNDVYKAVSPVGIAGMTNIANSISSNPTTTNIFQKLGFNPIGEEQK